MSLTAYPITIRDLAYREAVPTYCVAMHYHACWQWYCLVEGDVSMRFNDREVSLAAGDSILVAPQVERGPYCTGRAPRYIVSQFENHQLNLDGLSGCRLPMPARLDQAYLDLLAELRSPDHPNPYHLRYALFVRLLIGLRRRVGEGRRRDPSPLNARAQHEVVEQVDAYIRGHIDVGMSCERIARAVHLSAPHLNRLVRAHTGMSTNQRLIHWRVEQAKRNLLESSLSISQIAQLVGLTSFSYFTKVFTRQVGVSPSTYRREGGRRYVAAEPGDGPAPGCA